MMSASTHTHSLLLILVLTLLSLSTLPDIQTTADASLRFLVRASYVQIYNEVISDLLKPERVNLTIREDKRRGIYVEGLSEWVVRSPREVYGLMNKGSGVRIKGETRLNESSSRSHALFIIVVEQNEVRRDQPQAGREEKGRNRGGGGGGGDDERK